MAEAFPLGKLPTDLLAALLARYPAGDPRIIVGPRPGEDAAVLDLGADQYLIAKTDPITFATDEIGWYAVNVNANDIAATGGVPQWFMATLLLPPHTGKSAVEKLFDQLGQACNGLDISLIGGHTEVTHGIDRPIVVGMMLGLVEKHRLVTTGGAQPGDMLLMTKGYPIEGIAIIAREKPERLREHFSGQYIERCANFLHQPGISIVPDARIAQQAGEVHAMHDPTEGGVATGLWEVAETSAARLVVNLDNALLEEGRQLCAVTGLDPLGVIASGALLLSVRAEDVQSVKDALIDHGLAAYQVGHVEEGSPDVIDEQEGKPLNRPIRDEIARLYE